MKVVHFTTSDGAGEATQLSSGEWLVTWPYGSFKFWGVLHELKREVRQRYAGYGFEDKIVWSKGG